jgi:hypothetical protein
MIMKALVSDKPNHASFNDLVINLQGNGSFTMYVMLGISGQ